MALRRGEQLVTPANREPKPHHRIIEDLDEPVELRLGDAESRAHIVYAIAAVYAAPAGQTVVTLAVPPGACTGWPQTPTE
jgi:hypothetical protein